MPTPESGPKMLGGHALYCRLYEQKVGNDGKSLGVRTPEGVWYSFNNGEKFVQVRVEGIEGRAPAIQLEDGRKIWFDEWTSTQPKPFIPGYQKDKQR